MGKWVTLHRRACTSTSPRPASARRASTGNSHPGATDPSCPSLEPNAGDDLSPLFDSAALPTVFKKLLLAMTAAGASLDGDDDFEEMKMGLDELLRGVLPNLVCLLVCVIFVFLCFCVFVCVFFVWASYRNGPRVDDEASSCRADMIDDLACAIRFSCVSVWP